MSRRKEDVRFDVVFSGDIDTSEIDGLPRGERAVIVNREVVHDLAHVANFE